MTYDFNPFKHIEVSFIASHMVFPGSLHALVPLKPNVSVLCFETFCIILRAAVKVYHRLSDSHNKMDCLTVLEAGSLGSRCGQGSAF